MSAVLENVLSRVERAKRNGSGYIARCPAHDDRHPSLAISEGDDGRVLLHCHAGCETAAILAALRLTEADLFEARNGSGHAEIVATYGYVDESGEPLFQVCRRSDKQFPQRRPDGAGGWTWGIVGVRRVLYRLPAIVEAVGVGERVWIAEGEKDVEALERAGVVATCNPGGAGKWSSEYAEVLRGADVVVVPDRDQAGYARQVVASLKGIASSIEIRLPAEGKDAADHLAAGHGLGDFELATLDTLVPEPDAAEEDDQRDVVFVTLREFLELDFPKAESLVGQVRDGTNLLPSFGWFMPWGPAGSGKTSIVADLLFHAAAGKQWLHYPIARKLRIVAIVNEGVPGGFQDKLAEKVETWDEKEGPLDGLAVYASPWGEFTFRNERMVRHLSDFARDFGADYVAGDPLHTLGTTGSGTPEETEAFKHLLRSFGVWEWIGIVTVHHSNKAGMVSGDWPRHPDTVLHVEKDGRFPRSKLTLQKARPADPAELGVPLLLDWVVDTKSYRLLEADPEKAGDANRERVLEAVCDGLRSAADVAERTGLSPRTVKRHFRALEEARLVRLEEGPNNTLLAAPKDEDDRLDDDEPTLEEETGWI